MVIDVQLHYLNIRQHTHNSVLNFWQTIPARVHTEREGQTHSNGAREEWRWRGGAETIRSQGMTPQNAAAIQGIVLQLL